MMADDIYKSNMTRMRGTKKNYTKTWLDVAAFMRFEQTIFFISNKMSWSIKRERQKREHKIGKELPYTALHCKEDAILAFEQPAAQARPLMHLWMIMRVFYNNQKIHAESKRK